MATKPPTKGGALRLCRRPVIFFPLPNSLPCASRCRNSKCFLTALIAAALVPTNAHLSPTWPNAFKRIILCLQQPRATGSKDWQRNIRYKGILKHLKIDPFEITALLLIALAISLRILLATQGWPRTNSDEDTIGLMALHI